MTAHIGDIRTSKVWASIELLPHSRGWVWPHIGPTYHGTKTGLFLALGRVVIIAHIRCAPSVH